MADRGVLWFSIAALFALFARGRVALRGIASLTVASILANLVGKKLFGGDRPLLKDIPLGRRLKKYPTSRSFPSGHSASAAAFAVGVTLESRRLGLAIVPVAAGVIYSRLHTGAHWLSDVVGGAALGAAVASVGKIVVPGRGKQGRPGGRDGYQIELPALPDGEGVFIVVNPASGTSIARPDPVPRLEKRLPRARLHQLKDGEDLVEVVSEAIAVNARTAGEHKLLAVGVCGGDGSVAAVAQQARNAGLPLFVLPGGTFNNFAGSVRIESLDRAIEALQAGTGVRVDVAELRIASGGADGSGVTGDDPITVLNTASVGIYPRFVLERDKREKRLGKWLAGAVAAVRVLRASEPLSVVIDGRAGRVWSLFVGVNRNQPGIIAPLRRRHLQGRMLDVRILHAGSRLSAVMPLVFGDRMSRALKKFNEWPEHTVLGSFITDAVSLIVLPRRGQPPGFAHDGEVWTAGADAHGDYSCTLRLVPGGLDVYSAVG